MELLQVLKARRTALVKKIRTYSTTKPQDSHSAEWREFDRVGRIVENIRHLENEIAAAKKEIKLKAA